MTARVCSLFLLAALLAIPAAAKDKKKSSLPEYVLRATTVRVVINPDAGEPLNQPMANANARDNVEKALLQWGRLTPVMDGQESDLVIAVRTGNGRMVQPSIRGGPIDQRPGTAQGGDGNIRIGGQQGQPPPLNDPAWGRKMVRKMVRRLPMKSDPPKIASRCIAAAWNIRWIRLPSSAT